MFKALALFLISIKVLFEPVPAPEIAAQIVPDFDSRVLPNYSAPIWERSRGHRGIDIELARGEQIAAPFAGSVSFVGKVFQRRVITIRSGNLLASFEPVCSDLRVGQVVVAGEAIATRCAGDEDYREHCEGCVHFSVRTERGYLNPLLFYNRIRPSSIVS